jgi:hypothetical protein
MGGGDENVTYRMDLEKQYWVKTVPVTGAKGRIRFGDADGLATISDLGGRAYWIDDNDLWAGYRGFSYRLVRVK